MAYNQIFISTDWSFIGRNPILTSHKPVTFKQVLNPKETLKLYSQAELPTVWKSHK